MTHSDEDRPARGEDLPQINLREIAMTLSRRKATIVATTLAGLVLAGLYILQATPRYDAQALLLIGARSNPVLNSVDDVVRQLNGDEEEISSEVEIIHARRLAGMVVADLDLVRDPGFNPGLRESGLPDKVLAWFDTLAGTSFRQPPPAAQLRSLAINNFQKNLEVYQVGRSQVVAIRFRSTDPVQAATIANALADRYLRDQLDSKFSANNQASGLLGERLATLRADVAAAEERVVRFKSENGLLNGTRASIVTEQLSVLAGRRAIAQAELAQARARADLVRQLVADSEIRTLAEVLNSPVVQRLRQEETELLRKMAELGTRFGPRHPQSIDASAELAELRQGLDDEIAAIQQGITTAVAGARSQVAAITREMDSLQARLEAQDVNLIELRALEREAEASRQLLETVLERYKQTSQQDGLSQADARIVQRADVPIDPAWPKKPLLLGGGGVLFLLLGIGLALAMEAFDRRILSPERLEQTLGHRVLGLVPVAGRRGLAPVDVPVRKPTSIYTESLRSIHTALCAGQAPGVVLVASSTTGEGKSTLAVSLARLVAGRGQKVLVLDCDIRRPTVHRFMGCRNLAGVVEYLRDGTALAGLVRDDPKSQAKFISPGRWHSDSVELFRSDRMKQLLSGLRKDYDLILIDSPPLLSLSDARVLAGLADTSLLSVRWRSTACEMVAHSLRLLRDVGAPVAGFVVTRADIGKLASYGYGGSQYDAAHRKYYVDA